VAGRLSLGKLAFLTDAMSSGLAATLPGIQAPEGLRGQLARAERRRKLRAVSLTLPLLLFLLLTFLVPIAALLKRAVENPEVADALPRTVAALQGWNRTGMPDAPAFAAIAQDLAALPDSSDAGALARRLNSETPGARSLVMATFRSLPLAGTSPATSATDIKAALLALDARWAETKYWQAIAKNGSRWTPDYLLTSVDLRRDAQGAVERVDPDQRVFGAILVRTFQISAIVTLWCLLLGYPLAYWLSTLSARQADDPGAGAVLDLDPGARGGLDRAAAVGRAGEPCADRTTRRRTAARAAVQPHRRRDLDGTHPAALHDPAAVQRDEERAD
jgi:putative spermidine/putrescine transport system permease protein